MYSPGTCLEELRRTQNHLSKDSWCPVRNSKPAPPKYEFVSHQLTFKQVWFEVLAERTWNDITPCSPVIKFRRSVIFLSSGLKRMLNNKHFIGSRYPGTCIDWATSTPHFGLVQIFQHSRDSYGLDNHGIGLRYSAGTRDFPPLCPAPYPIDTMDYFHGSEMAGTWTWPRTSI
jgi:hypothetical protein